MKKLLTSALIASLFLPGVAFAAYNDVTLGSSARVTAAGQTLNVEGDSNVIETIGVESNFITFTLKVNSFLVLTSPNYKQIEWSATSTRYVTASTCESNSSRVRFASTDAEVTITVFPKSVSCPVGSASTGGSSGSSGGGGGSSSSNTNAVAATTVVPAPVTTTVTVASLQAQLNALLAQLAALQGGAVTPGVVTTPSSGAITANLSSGSKGPGVKALQQFLNTHGFVIASSGPGSPGKETELFGSLTVKAVQKFQEKYGIAKPGESGYGRVGPKTRAKINELSGN